MAIHRLVRNFHRGVCLTNERGLPITITAQEPGRPFPASLRPCWIWVWFGIWEVFSDVSQEKSFKEILRARDWNTRNKEFLFGEVLLRIHVVSEIKPKKNICFCLCISGAKCQSIFGTSEGPCLKVTDVYHWQRQELTDELLIHGRVLVCPYRTNGLPLPVKQGWLEAFYKSRRVIRLSLGTTLS